MTAETIGYAFATFRSHTLHMAIDGLRGGWTYPGYKVECLDDIHVPCACGHGYLVNEVYHYHSLNGICHNKVKCV